MDILNIKLKRINNAVTWQQTFRPHTPPPLGPVDQNTIFSGHSHVAYQIKENHECSNMVACRPPPPSPTTMGIGSVGQNSTFSEHGRVAYQIKGNHESSNMVANILPKDPPPPQLWGWGQQVKIQLYQNTVMLHIKLKGIMNAATW